MVLFTVAILASALPASTLAAPPPGKGKDGKTDDGTSSGGNGFNTPNPISLSLAFRNDESDTIRGDGFGAYTDEPRVPDSDYRMDVHIDGDSGGSYGNLFLRIRQGSRRVFLDIESGCELGCNETDDNGNIVTQNQPFTAREFDSLGLTVSANESIAGGLCGLDAGGDPITAPMQVIYQDDDPDNELGTTNPGFVDFFPVSKRRSPCYGLTSEVTVRRLDSDSWRVSGDRAACVRWPGGRKSPGVAVMPFEFQVDITSDSALSCN
jgi:hypothetical protein